MVSAFEFTFVDIFGETLLAKEKKSRYKEKTRNTYRSQCMSDEINNIVYPQPSVGEILTMKGPCVTMNKNDPNNKWKSKETDNP